MEILDLDGHGDNRKGAWPAQLRTPAFRPPPCYQNADTHPLRAALALLVQMLGTNWEYHINILARESVKLRV